MTQRHRAGAVALATVARSRRGWAAPCSRQAIAAERETDDGDGGPHPQPPARRRFGQDDGRAAAARAAATTRAGIRPCRESPARRGSTATRGSSPRTGTAGRPRAGRGATRPQSPTRRLRGRLDPGAARGDVAYAHRGDAARRARASRPSRPDSACACAHSGRCRRGGARSRRRSAGRPAGSRVAARPVVVHDISAM